ncbi:MAG: helix-turn-helix transcriptional regulator [Pseudomonadota bacterium]
MALSDDRKQRYKDKLGAAIKAARIKTGYTQKGLASELGLEYYTMVSQMEQGHIAIPATLWIPIATALDLDRDTWVLRCLHEYQPNVYKALFGRRSRSEVASVLKALRLGQM